MSDLEREVTDVMVADRVKLYAHDRAEDAASAFERYDLVSAPVVDATERLIGRLTVDAVVDYIRERSAESQLAEAGLSHEEDVFAPVLDSFKNRWSWLAINLVTAFIASRVIGAFEDSIAELVALAALMPIVAGIGGNSGNQTSTMIVRALALGQIEGGYWRKLLAKEIGVALLNGAVWGTLLGAIAYAFYGNVALGGVLGRGHGAQPGARRARRRGDPVAARALRARPGRGLLGAHHRLHGLGRVLHLPGTSHALPCLSA